MIRHLGHHPPRFGSTVDLVVVAQIGGVIREELPESILSTVREVPKIGHRGMV